MSSHKSTARGHAATATHVDHDSVARFVELLKLRSLAASTQSEYLRYIRKLATRVGRDPASLDEAQVRANLLHPKEAHHYSPSSMRTAVAALVAFYNLHLGREWKLFSLVRSPSAQTLPQVLTGAEVARFFAVVREERFIVIFRLIYACGSARPSASRWVICAAANASTCAPRWPSGTRSAISPCRQR